MKKKLFIAVTLSVLVMSMVSCNKSFLDDNPNKEDRFEIGYNEGWIKFYQRGYSNQHRFNKGVIIRNDSSVKFVKPNGIEDFTLPTKGGYYIYSQEVIQGYTRTLLRPIHSEYLFSDIDICSNYNMYTEYDSLTIPIVKAFDAKFKEVE